MRRRLLWNGGGVGTRIARSEVYLAATVPDHRRALPHGERKRLKQLDLMTTQRQGGANIGRDCFFHLNVAAVEGLLGETRLFERRLDVHAEIDDVGDELRVGLGLIPSTHDSETDMNVALFHEGGNDGVERSLVAGE